MSHPPPRPPYPQSPSTPSYPIQHPSPAFDSRTPPPPPRPKPSSHEPSRISTPQDGPPLPPPPSDTSFYHDDAPQPRYPPPASDFTPAAPPPPPALDDGWLPEIVKDKSLPHLPHLLHPPLPASLIHSPRTTHASHPPTLALALALSAQNIALAHQTLHLASTLPPLRATTSTHLLHLHALERQWRQQQSRLDDALAPFSPKALHQRLVASIGEQEQLLKGMEESFLEGEGRAGEREVEGFLRRWREGRRVLERRREARERWEEGRVGGWR